MNNINLDCVLGTKKNGEYKSFLDGYDDKKNILNFIAALIIIVFFIPYTASGFAACGNHRHQNCS